MKRLPEIIAVLLLISLYFIRIPSNRYNQVIHSDGKGYYAHLPALFIYNDLEYNFADEIEKKYYPEDGSLSKHFRFYFKGELVNKTFSGITILWLPFFLLAHFLSYLLGFELDGYSILYQLNIAFAAIFYCWLGCKLLLKLLQSYSIPKNIAGFVTLLFIFGSNYFYYVLLDPSLTHSYNFTLIIALFYLLRRYSQSQQTTYFIKASLVFALILCIRPQNGFVLLATPFFFDSFENFKTSIFRLFKNFKNLFLSIAGFLAIISIPMILWYLQTGYFLVYSYGEERFVFSNPQFINVLFSYQKGLFLYTPLILFSLLGLWKILKTSKFQFICLGIFFVINTYIIASWEEWWYGCSFGHRVFIDFYGIHAVLLAVFLNSIRTKNLVKHSINGLLVLSLGLNLFQSFQHYTSVVPSCYNNGELYWHNFLRIRPEARGTVDDNAILLNEAHNDFEINYPEWNNTMNIQTENQAFSGKYSGEIGLKSNFSNNYTHKLKGYEKWILISAEIMASDGEIEPKLVVDTRDSSGNSINYQLVELNRYVHENNWIHGQWKFEIEPSKTNYDVIIYFWQPRLNGSCFIDDFSVRIYSEN